MSFASDWRKVLAVLVALATFTPQLGAQPSSDVAWEPGKEMRIEDARAGTDGYFLVHVPSDYNSREKWPVVFYYHGLGGQPNTSLIKKIAASRYCIIVGMSYYAPGMQGYKFRETEDVRIIKHVLNVLKQYLVVDDSRLFVAGFSKGGFYSCEMLRILPQMFAGGIIFGAGSKSLKADWPMLHGKEIFMGCGEKDRFRAAATSTRDHFRNLGATVTFEEWPNTGHNVGDVAKVRRWLFEQTVARSLVPESERMFLVSAGDDESELPPTAFSETDALQRYIAVIAALLGVTTIILFAVIMRRRSSAATNVVHQEGRP